MYKKIGLVVLVMALAVTAFADEQWVGFSTDRPWSEAQIEVGTVGTRIVELDRGRLIDYPGDYANYLRRRAERDNAEAQANAQFDKRLAEDKPVTPAFLFAALLWVPGIEPVAVALGFSTLVVALGLVTLAIALGHLGPPTWGWKRITLTLVMGAGLFVAATVPEGSSAMAPLTGSPKAGGTTCPTTGGG